MLLVLLLCPGDKGLNAAAFPDALQARSRIGSLIPASLTVGFQDLSSAPTTRLRDNHSAHRKTPNDKSAFPQGVLSHPRVLPTASRLQLPDAGGFPQCL